MSDKMKFDINSISIAPIKVGDLYHYFFVILIFLLTYFCATIGVSKGDFMHHLKWLPTDQELLHPIMFFSKNPEPLWHILTRIINIVFNIPNTDAGGIVVAVSNVFCFELIKKYLNKYCNVIVASFFAFVSMIVIALWLPWYNNGQIYLGQWSPNVWHNPTNIVVRPFGFFVVFKSLDLMKTPLNTETLKCNIKNLILIALALFLSALSKPSFYQIFFPSIFIYCILQIINNSYKYFFNSIYLLFACIPTLVLFFIQFFVLFRSNIASASGTLSIKFLYCLRIFSKFPIFSALLAAAFPLSIFISVCALRIKTDSIYKFSILLYLVGLFEVMFLVENRRPADMNFIWGYSLGLSFLYASSIALFIKIINRPFLDNFKRRKNICVSIGSCLLIIQSIDGLIWLYRIILL